MAIWCPPGGAIPTLKEQLVINMRTARNPLLTTMILSVVAMLAPQFGQAQTRYFGPFGQWTNTISDPGNAVWDATAISNVTNLTLESIDRQGETNASLTCPIAFLQLGSGALRWRGLAIANFTYQGADLGWVAADPFEAGYRVSGKVSSSGAKTRGSVHSVVNGSVVIGGSKRRLNLTHDVSFTFDNVAKTCSTVVKDTGTFPGPRSVSSAGSSTRRFGPMPLSSFIAGDGSWKLNMTLLTSVRRVVGSAFVTLDTGPMHFYSVKGIYRAANQHSTLVLTGVGLSKGSNLQVSMNGDTVTAIKGRVSGQLVNAAF